MDSASQFLSIAAVLGLLGFVAWRFRASRAGGARLWSGRAPQQLRVVERVALTPQHSLHLVAVGSEVLLIGAGPGGVALIRNAGREGPSGGVGGA
jgi:flagellar biogenesis protein FliO